jgi:hypothetical protein
VEQLEQPLPSTRAKSGELVHLITPRLPAHAPLAEVFAVVLQWVIAILAEPQASPTDHLLRVEIAGLLRPDSDFATDRKLRKRNLFHGASTQPA